MKRTFIAFDIQANSRTTGCYNEIRDKLRFERISWVPEHNLHITLKFLGNTDERLVPSVIEAIQLTTVQFNTMKLELRGLGVFKNLREPRVLWMGCEYEKSLPLLAFALNNNLKKLGFEAESRNFTPHLTLGRIKAIKEPHLLADLLSHFSQTVFQLQEITEIVFYESNLKASGSEYIPIHKIKLASKV